MWKKCGKFRHFSGSMACKKAVKVEKVGAQHEKKYASQVEVEKMGVLVDDRGPPVSVVTI